MSMLETTCWLSPVVVAALQFVQPRASQAQDWPNRPVKIIVPFAPGGNADGMARIIGQRLGEVFGQQFVVENRTGAGGTIAVEGGRALAGRRLHAAVGRAAADRDHPGA